MTKTFCDHCKREYEPPVQDEYTFKVLGKDNQGYLLSVIPFTPVDECVHVCVDCLTYLMGHV